MPQLPPPPPAVISPAPPAYFKDLAQALRTCRTRPVLFFLAGTEAERTEAEAYLRRAHPLGSGGPQAPILCLSSKPAAEALGPVPCLELRSCRLPVVLILEPHGPSVVALVRWPLPSAEEKAAELLKQAAYDQKKAAHDEEERGRLEAYEVSRRRAMAEGKGVGGFVSAPFPPRDDEVRTFDEDLEALLPSLPEIRDSPGDPASFLPLGVRAAHLEGEVEVLVTLNPRGVPSAVQALQGPSALRLPAEQFALAHRFTPLRVGGIRRWGHYRLRVHFQPAPLGVWDAPTAPAHR